MSPSRRLSRRHFAVVLGAAFLWATVRAGVTDDVVNQRGWNSFSEFWRTAADPELGGDFVRLTIDAAGVTLAFAVLGTLLSIVLGACGALALSERLWGRGLRWNIARLIGVVPRAVHEVIWVLLLVQIFGFDPLVAVLAIGVPFGAVTAKVFAETIDEADPAPYRSLRATGAGRLSALAYGILPTISGDLLSYAFYRFECAIRSAAVLGVIGVGGLGYQLDLSFQTLRYPEIWTLVFALMILSVGADWWSDTVRTRPSRTLRWASLAGLVVLVPLSWRWSGLDLGRSLSNRSLGLARDLVGDLFPPSLGPGGFSVLWDASIDTLAMSVLAITIAALGGLLLAVAARRPAEPRRGSGAAGFSRRLGAKAVLLLMRAVPAPVWAFLFVLVLFPGTWPGAIALGVYNLGVIGRLFTEVLDEHDQSPARQLVVTGATPTQAFLYATLPSATPRLLSVALYRWEVVLRETVVVGVVGAGGLGRLIQEHLAARDFASVLGAIGALIVLSLLVDTIGGWLRVALRATRTPAHH